MKTLKEFTVELVEFVESIENGMGWIDDDYIDESWENMFGYELLEWRLDMLYCALREKDLIRDGGILEMHNVGCDCYNCL